MECANGKFKKVSENLGSMKYHRGIFGAMIFHCFDVCMRLECWVWVLGCFAIGIIFFVLFFANQPNYVTK
jgi:hypothetical protein